MDDDFNGHDEIMTDADFEQAIELLEQQTVEGDNVTELLSKQSIAWQLKG